MSTTTYTAFVERLEAALAPIAAPDLHVGRGLPVDSQHRRYIAIGGVENGTSQWSTMRAGRKKREESYKVVVNVSASDITYADAEDQGIALMAQVETLFADDPTLGTGTPTLRANVEEWEMDTRYDGDRGYRCIVVVKILVEARLA